MTPPTPPEGNACPECGAPPPFFSARDVCSTCPQPKAGIPILPPTPPDVNMKSSVDDCPIHGVFKNNTIGHCNCPTPPEGNATVSEPTYFGPCVKCGNTHGGWEPCPPDDPTAALIAEFECQVRLDERGQFESESKETTDARNALCNHFRRAPESVSLTERERRRFIQGFVEGAEWRDARRMSTFRDIRTPASAYAEERFDAMTERASPLSAPPATCDCDGLWNDSTIRMGPEAREVYNRTGHLPNCSATSPSPVPPDGLTELWGALDALEADAKMKFCSTKAARSRIEQLFTRLTEELAKVTKRESDRIGHRDNLLNERAVEITRLTEERDGLKRHIVDQLGRLLSGSTTEKK